MVSDVTLSSGRRSVTVPFTRTRAEIGRDIERMRTGRPVTEETADVITAVEGPDALYPIPTDDTFEAEDAEYLPAFDLEQIAAVLLADCPEFGFLRKYSIGYLWKRTGAVKNQKATLGTCSKAPPKVRFYAKVTFLIEISADKCREHLLTNFQMEALVFHELCHAFEKVTKQGDIKPAIIGHDLEMFFSEYRRYGTWRVDLEQAERVFRQEELSFDDPGAGEASSGTERLAAMFGQHREAAAWVGGQG